MKSTIAITKGQIQSKFISQNKHNIISDRFKHTISLKNSNESLTVIGKLCCWFILRIFFNWMAVVIIVSCSILNLFQQQAERIESIDWISRWIQQTDKLEIGAFHLNWKQFRVSCCAFTFNIKNSTAITVQLYVFQAHSSWIVFPTVHRNLSVLL